MYIHILYNINYYMTYTSNICVEYMFKYPIDVSTYTV